MRSLLLVLSFAAILPSETMAEDERNRFDPAVAEFAKRFEGRGALTDGSQRPPPDRSKEEIELAEGLSADIVLHEPAVRQPLNLYFDERGRMWVVEYLQYPFPAGLKVVKYDEY